MEGFFYFILAAKRTFSFCDVRQNFILFYFLFSKLIYIKLQQWKQLIHSLVELTAAQKKNPELFWE